MIRAGLVVLVAVGALLLGAGPASAAIALIQSSPEATGAGTTVTATLPTAPATGDLLVAVIEDKSTHCTTDTFAATGWVQVGSSCRGGVVSGNTGPVAILYLANVAPGTPAAVTFSTGNASANTRVRVTEWSGATVASPLDTSGTGSAASGSTSATATTTGTVSAANELAITAFDTGATTYSPGGGWTSEIADAANGLYSDYQLGPASGSTASETATSSPGSGRWGEVIAVFKAAGPCSAGALSVSTAPSFTMPNLTLNAYNSASASGTLNVTVGDASGSGSGWNLTASSTTLTAGANTLPNTATSITSASASAATGNCTMPTNQKTYPFTLPVGSSAALFDATASTGSGPVNLSFGVKMQAPGNARTGAYTSTWTLTMATGP